MKLVNKLTLDSKLKAQEFAIVAKRFDDGAQIFKMCETYSNLPEFLKNVTYPWQPCLHP